VIKEEVSAHYLIKKPVTNLDF